MIFIDLTRSNQDLTLMARNQYQSTLEGMSFEALYKLAWEEHGVKGKVTQPKAELIQKILDAKYGVPK